MLKTLVLIQENKLEKCQLKISNNIVCKFCTSECTFYKCSEDKASIYEKRLSTIGFNLFIFLSKVKLVFPSLLAIDMKVNVGREGYNSQLRAIELILNQYIQKFQEFSVKFHNKMMIEFKKSQKISLKTKSMIRSPSIKGKNKVGDERNNEIPSSVIGLRENIGIQNNMSRMEHQNSLDLSAGADKLKQEDFKDVLSNIDKPNEVKSQKSDGYRRVKTGDNLVEDHIDNRSVESLKYILTIDQPSEHKDASKYEHAKNEGEFTPIDLIYEKFSELQELSQMVKSERGKMIGEEVLDSLSDTARSIFKKEEVSTIVDAYSNYVSSLSSYKVSKAIKYYESHLQTVMLQHQKTGIPEEDFYRVMQSTMFYAVPSIFAYFTKETEQSLISILLKYPPRTRKVILLKEMNLNLGKLLAYQKLYTFKGLSWIVWTADIIKAINILVIVFINVYELFTFDLNNKDSATEGLFLYTSMIVSCCISGICSLFTPIEKLFLAKTYLTMFTSYKNRQDIDLKESESRNRIIETEENKIIALKNYNKVLTVIQSVLDYRLSKFVVALFHYDNMFQFTIFILGLFSITSKTLLGINISLFLFLLKTNTLYQIYEYLSIRPKALLVYTCFVLIVLYQFGVFYFSVFQQESESGDGIQCTNLHNCISYADNLGLMGNEGYTAFSTTPYKSSSRYLGKLFSDTFVFLVISLLTSLMLLVVQLRSRRLLFYKQEQILKEHCLICGVSKTEIEQTGAKWKEHIYEEHNFHKILLYIIYLLDIPEGHCDNNEELLKEKILNCEEEFFDLLKHERLPNRLK